MKTRILSKIKVVVMMSVLLLLSWNIPCSAGESADKEVEKDVEKNVSQGGLKDKVMGAAVIAFTRKTGEQPDYLSLNKIDRIGTRTPFGFAFCKTNRPLCTIEKGRATFGIPFIIPDFRDKTVKGTALVISAEIIRGEF
jgi:hypothetical protein